LNPITPHAIFPIAIIAREIRGKKDAEKPTIVSDAAVAWWVGLGRIGAGSVDRFVGLCRDGADRPFRLGLF